MFTRNAKKLIYFVVDSNRKFVCSRSSIFEEKKLRSQNHIGLFESKFKYFYVHAFMTLLFLRECRNVDFDNSELFCRHNLADEVFRRRFWPMKHLIILPTFFGWKYLTDGIIWQVYRLFRSIWQIIVICGHGPDYQKIRKMPEKNNLKI